ncbi:hypothetical protein [Ensifer adhaerens]|uniref:hypothetical protein n=1 Tax=Ensifer adhaerens TaxID=106592 RepID=UPI003F84F8B0
MTSEDPKASPVDTLLDPASTRFDIDAALEDAAPTVAGKVIEHIGSSEAVYIVGCVHDFDEFASRIVDSLPRTIAGAACLGTARSPFDFPNGKRSFDISSEFVEETSFFEPSVLLCQSIVADEFEVVVMVSRLLTFLKPRKLVIGSVILDEAVEASLRTFFRGIGIEVRFGCEQRLASSQQATRDRVFETLDDRMLKYAPLMSKWMMERMYGPRPTYDNDLGSDYVP